MKQPQIIQLPKFLDERGNLSFFENENQIPFTIRRMHWIYDVPGGEERGGLAYKTTEEFIVAMSGSFDVLVDDGQQQYRFSLNRSYMGVYVPAGTWRMIDNYSTNSVAVIAASTHYDPEDAIREFEDFRSWRMESNQKDLKKNTESSVIENDLNEMTPQSACLQASRQLDDSSRTDIVAQSLLDESVQKMPKNPENKYSVYDCGIIELDRHHSQRKGDISVVENGKEVPFDVKRIYYLYDVPGGESRGSHGHKHLQQLILAASGAFTVTLDDGENKKAFILNRPYQGLLIKPGIWRTLDDFSSGSVCLVLASEKYDEADYIRDYSEFIEFRNSL